MWSAADKLGVFLRDPEVNWQPMISPRSFHAGRHAGAERRRRSPRLPEDAPSLVGDMITEEALPSYAS